MGWNRVFYYDFQKDAADVGRNIWASPHYIDEKNNPAFYGRTGIRNPHDFKGEIGLVPCTVKNGADLRLSTYNPEAPDHDTFLGSEIFTKETFGANGEHFRFEAVVQSPTIPGGGG